MKITVIGMGYVGTVAAVCLADSGNDVVVVDINTAKIAQLNAAYSRGRELVTDRPVLDLAGAGRPAIAAVNYHGLSW